MSVRRRALKTLAGAERGLVPGANLFTVKFGRTRYMRTCDWTEACIQTNGQTGRRRGRPDCTVTDRSLSTARTVGVGLVPVRSSLFHHVGADKINPDMKRQRSEKIKSGKNKSSDLDHRKQFTASTTSTFILD